MYDSPRARAGVALTSAQPYPDCMRVIGCVLLLVGCGSAMTDVGGAGGSAGIAGSGGFFVPSEAGSGGAIGDSSSAGASAGMATGGSEPSAGSSSGGAGGDRAEAAGAAGDVAAAGSAGDGGEGGATPAEPVLGSLWTACPYPPTLPLYCSSELTCGQYLEREGGQPGYVCTFGCWSLQGTKMAPDAVLTAQCTAAGGVCYAASSGYYPTCVPKLPEPAP